MEEILLKLRRLKGAIENTVGNLSNSFETWKVPWTQARAEKIDRLSMIPNPLEGYQIMVAKNATFPFEINGGGVFVGVRTKMINGGQPPVVIKVTRDGEIVYNQKLNYKLASSGTDPSLVIFPPDYMAAVRPTGDRSLFYNETTGRINVLKKYPNELVEDYAPEAVDYYHCLSEYVFSDNNLKIELSEGSGGGLFSGTYLIYGVKT